MSTPRTLLLLGGYGNAGRPVAELLLKFTPGHVRLAIAGRSLSKATAFTEDLNRRHEGNRVDAVLADASDQASLETAFRGASMVVVLSSTSQYTENVARAALEAGADYYDIILSSEKLAVLQKLSPKIQESPDRIFITEGGFHPGLPAAMVRYVATKFDEIRTAEIGSVIWVDWRKVEMSDSTLEEMIVEFANMKSIIYVDGKWKDVGMMTSSKYMDFGNPIGRQYGVPWLFEELKPLPQEIPSLQQVAFYIGGLNWFVDYVLSPIIVLWQKLSPKAGRLLLGKMLHWGLKTFQKGEPFITVLQLESRGVTNGQDRRGVLRISHQDAYTLTAIPVVATILQYLDGDLRRSGGLSYQGLVVEPKRFLKDLEILGADVSYEETAL